MAAVRRLVLDGVVSPENVAYWVKGHQIDEKEQKILDAYSELKCDLAPEFLNKLREDTQPIIENGVAQSPVKTPQSKAPLKHEPSKRRQSNGQGKLRCTNLFALGGKQIQEGCTDSPGHRSDLQCQSHEQYSLSAQGSNQSADSRTANASYKEQSGNNSLNQCEQPWSRHTGSAISSSSPVNKSPITGSLDTSYCSSNPFSSTPIKSASPGTPRSRHHDDSGSFQGTSDSRSVGKGSKHFYSPSDHSSGNKQRSAGRSGQGLSLGDFLLPGDQQRQEGASPELPGQQRRGREGKGGGKKKKKGGQSQGRQQSDCSNSPTTFTSDSEDFPSISPDASASLASRSPTAGTILTPGSSPICDEIRVRVGVPNKTSAGQGSRNRDTAASPVAALDFTANKVTQASPSAWPSAGAGQKCHTTGNQSAWGKNGSLTNGKSPPGNLVWPHDMGEKMPDSPRSWARVLNSGLKPAHCPGMKNGLRTLGGVANAGLDEHPGLGDGRGRVSPHRNAVSSMPSPDSFKFPTKTREDPVISPKCVEPVRLIRTPASSFSGETVLSSEFLIGSSRDGGAMDQSWTQGSSTRPSCVSLSETQGGSLSFTPVKRVNLSDSGDQIKTPIKTEGSWSLPSVNPTTPCTPDKPLLEHSVSIVNLVKASPHEVTHKPMLDLYIRLYSACLDAHLFPNLSMELHFLAQLLITQASQEDLPAQPETVNNDIEDRNFFQSVHNVVYFAVGVLDKQAELVKQLDRSTLQLLSENERVQDFSPTLHQEMKAAFDAIEDSHSTCSSQNNSIAAVSFKSETDNRTNFPTDRSFHSFKKLRDGFFYLMKEWERNHERPDWSLSRNHGSRIRDMFDDADLAAHLHFSRLFVSQLITSCKHQQVINTKADFKDILELISLKKANPEKYLKLQERLIKPASCGSPCPTVSFPGHQQFFYDFIITASNVQLNQHVSNTMVFQIDELNQADFASQGEKVSQEKREEECEDFSSALLTLRLLARFLGFILHLPYQGASSLPQHLLQDNMDLRNKLPPPLDASKYLSTASAQGRLALTVPWVVEYMAMMDTAATHTTYVKQLLADLRLLSSLVWEELKSLGFTYSRLLVVASIGWLFDQPYMPVGYFFKECEPEPLLTSIAPEAKECTDLVTQDLFYSCCPYFGEMRYLLTEFSLGARAKTDVRKVNPRPPKVSVTVAPSVVSKNPNTKLTQNKLLGNFFHMYSKSTHRLVEFVADRISSNLIKDLRHKALPSALHRCEGEGLLMSSVNDKATRLYTETVNKMHEDMERCMDPVVQSLELMLPSNMDERVVEFSLNMARTLTRRKIRRWINANVKFDVFYNEMKTMVAQKTSSFARQTDEKPLEWGATPLKQKQVPVMKSVQHLGSEASVPSQAGVLHTHRVEGLAAAVVSVELPASAKNTSSQLCEKAAAQQPSASGTCGSISVVCDASKNDRLSVKDVEHFDKTEPKDEILLTSPPDDDSAVLLSAKYRRSATPTTADSSTCVTSAPTDSSPAVTPVFAGFSTCVTSAPTDFSSSMTPAFADCSTCVTSAPTDSSSSMTPTFADSNTCMISTPTDSSSSMTPAFADCNTCLISTPTDSSSFLISAFADCNTCVTSAPTDSSSSMTPAFADCNTCVTSAPTDSKSPFALQAAGGRSPATAAVLDVGGYAVAPLQDEDASSRLSAPGDDKGSHPSDSSKQLHGSVGCEAVKTDAEIGAVREAEEVGEHMLCHMMGEIQDLLWNLEMESDGDENSDEAEHITREKLHSLIQHILDCLSGSEEQLPQTIPSLALALTQLAVAVVFYQPALWSGETTSLFLRLWSAVSTGQAELPALLTTVFLGHLDEAPDVELSLHLYVDLLAGLVSKGYFTQGQIEDTFDECLSQFQIHGGKIQAVIRDLSEHIKNSL